jgi:transposase
MSFLTDEEKAQLRAQHKRERDKRICDRIKAVLLRDKGWSIAAIAEALLLSDDAVREHISEYKESKKLEPESGGSVEKISIEQSAHLEGHLQGHTYLYVKDIAAYVRAQFGITYTIHGLTDWLQRHGFSYKKPAIVPGKANKEQQDFEDFRSAVFGFFKALSELDAQSVLGQNFRSRIRDRFRSIESPVTCS